MNSFLSYKVYEKCFWILLYFRYFEINFYVVFYELLKDGLLIFWKLFRKLYVEGNKRYVLMGINFMYKVVLVN